MHIRLVIQLHMNLKLYFSKFSHGAVSPTN